jgi:hypothetical protein
VKRVTEKRKVGGSIPPLATTLFIEVKALKCGLNDASIPREIAEMGPKWGQIGSAAADVKTIVERVECGCDVVKLIVKQVCVGVCGHGDRRVAHCLLEESQVGAGST